MKKMKFKALKYISLAFIVVNLSGCTQQVNSADVIKQVEDAQKQVSSYHILWKQNEYQYQDEKGMIPDVETVANGQIILQEGGSGSRIDKVKGIVTDKTEVVANATTGMIRYHQNDWEQTLTPNSALGNIITIPYDKAVNFAKELAETDGVVLKSNLTTYQLYYVGDSDVVLKAIQQLLGVQVPSDNQIDLKIAIDKASCYVETVEIHLVQNNGIQHEKNVEVLYNGINQQTLKELPVK